jgi:response regulator RpfG family c-di-GMP phosphodiesterase
VALNDKLAVQLERLETLNQTLHKNLDRSILLCLKTMETFFPLLGRQARRVFGLCQAMGDDLGLVREDRRILEVSSRLFDIGLVGCPRELIRKWQHTPDMMGDEERAIIQLHPALGQDLACFGADLGEVGPVIRAHHERYDGEGYPDGLSGERIPWLARLLAVAVAFATFPSSEEAALERVKADSGSAFDPDAVRALVRSLPQTVIPNRQREVLLAELQPGMVVAQGIHTAYGLLLVPEGQALTESHIQLLRNHNQITPITQSLLVYC